MKFPTRENIDRWMFDYTEGNLSPEQETLLENYILNNPDLEVDLDAWQMATVSTEELVYAEKDKAYKKRRLLPYYIGAFSALLVISMLLWNYNQIQSNLQHQVAQSSSTTNKATKSVATNAAATENSTNSVLTSTTINTEQNLVNDANELASVNTTIQTNKPTNQATNKTTDRPTNQV